MLTMSGALSDFYQKLQRMNAGCIVIFGQADILDPTKATIGVGSSVPPAAALSLFQQLLRPTDDTFKVISGILLGDRKIEDLTEEQHKQLAESAANIVAIIIPTLTIAGLRQEDQKLVKPASSLISL